ncbi:hypothetical protein RRG08_062608 [Elysia crispata]|uniref:Uncharacterized protein n=1 Tax=Elysia crispata TaxID=231223 RepID=A0AAE0YZP4_9GAST|nr:hypothetical protein RRG08_062608 [Elysia crispata]
MVTIPDCPCPEMTTVVALLGHVTVRSSTSLNYRDEAHSHRWLCRVLRLLLTTGGSELSQHLFLLASFHFAILDKTVWDFASRACRRPLILRSCRVSGHQEPSGTR